MSQILLRMFFDVHVEAFLLHTYPEVLGHTVRSCSALTGISKPFSKVDVSFYFLNGVSQPYVHPPPQVLNFSHSGDCKGCHWLLIFISLKTN